MCRVFRYIPICLIVFLLSSCYTATKISVSAEPGTEILTTDFKVLAVANSSGEATFSNPDDNLIGFLYSRNPSSPNYIPFALDYQHKKYGAKAAAITSTVAFAAGAIGGIALVIAGGAGSVAALASCGVMLAGLSSAFPFWTKSCQANQEYEYKYLENQKTNDDLSFTPIILPDSDAKSSLSENTSLSSSKSLKTFASSTSAKTFKKTVPLSSGLYVGSGSLLKNDIVIERYDNIKVSINVLSETTAGVNVIEDNGGKFFAEDIQYSIKKNTSNDYILTIPQIDAAIITITTDGKMVLTHPRIKIDGDIYILNITAKYHR